MDDFSSDGHHGSDGRHDGAPPRRKPPRLPFRILVVDDDADTVESTQVLLRLLGAQVQIAGDALAAHRIAMRFLPEVVLMDISMPQVDGYTAARRLRAEEWGRQMILVAMTGWGRLEDRLAAESAGFDGHLVKPVRIDDLCSLLEGLTGRGSNEARDAAAG